MWHPDMPEEYKNQIVTGDAWELAKRIPDESIDLIFTDPVYDRIEDYEWLAETTAKILRMGGNLLVQSDKSTILEKFLAMDGRGLIWQTILAEVFPISCGTIAPSKTMKGWQPYLWYSLGKRMGKWCFDRHYSKRDRRLHKWGDSVSLPLVYIELLTMGGNVVFDPFTGSGTVPAVCKILGRNYIAFEIDPATAELARERVLNTQPPLFVMEPEQLELLDE